MKKNFLLFAMLPLLFSCNNETNQESIEKSGSESETLTENNTLNDPTATVANFNIESIPLIDKDLGEFPYFTLPEGLISPKAINRKFDVCFFPFGGVMTPVEGRLYKTYVMAPRGEEYSQRYFEKSMEDYLLSIGGVKVFDGEITREEYDRYHKDDPNKGDEGDMGYAGQNIKFYIIRTPKQGNVYVQFTSTNASGYLNILQEDSFVQTIQKITAQEILDDLNEKGKSVLYINFDVDQSVVKAENRETIVQIVEALQQNQNLKISIEGHTDDTGNSAHNKTLSENRAKAVMNEIISLGIPAERLKSAGFGSEKPLVANDSDANKALNRRVELVKQ